MATSLKKLGISEVDTWNAPALLHEPHVRKSVKKVHMDFLESGVDILSANTYAADYGITDGGVDENFKRTQWVFDNLDLAKETIDEFVKSQNTLFGNEVQRPLLVMPIASFASGIIGRASTANRQQKDQDDYHRCEGYGFPASDIRSYFEGRLNDDVLRYAGKTGVAMLAFETIGDLLEVEIICTMLEEKAGVLEEAGLSAWIALTCGTADSVDTGDSIASCVEKMAKCPHVTCVGVNCTEPHLITPIVGTMKNVLKECGAEDKLIVVYPNSGETYISRELMAGETDHWVMTSACQDWNLVDAAMGWVDSGVNIVGGCCRIDAASIAGLVEGIRNHEIRHED